MNPAKLIKSCDHILDKAMPHLTEGQLIRTLFVDVKALAVSIQRDKTSIKKLQLRVYKLEKALKTFNEPLKLIPGPRKEPNDPNSV